MKTLKAFLQITPWLVSILLCSNAHATTHTKHIVVATSAATLTNVPYWVGIERGFFDELGLSVKYVLMRSDLAVKGLITGDVDYMQSSSSVLRAAVAGAPVVTIFGFYNRTFFELVARPEIKSLANLRGKTIGISRYGASTEYAVRFGLKANGIDPEKEVKLVAVGGDAGRISALQGRIVDAAVLQVPANLSAHKLGAHTILFLGDYLETLLAGAGTSQRKLEQEHNEVTRLLKGLVKSIDYMKSHPSETKAIIRKNFRGIEADVVDHIYDLGTKHVTRNGIPSEKALFNTLLGTPYEGKISNFQKFADFSIAKEVVQ